MHGISPDLMRFMLEEIEDHANKLHDLCTHEDPDTEQAEYHHAKIGTMLGALDKSHTL